MGERKLPAPSTYKVTFSDRDDNGDLKTEIIIAHDYEHVPGGAVIFSMFEFHPMGPDPAWFKVRSLNQHEWVDITRIASSADNARVDRLLLD